MNDIDKANRQIPRPQTLRDRNSPLDIYDDAFVFDKLIHVCRHVSNTQQEPPRKSVREKLLLSWREQRISSAMKEYLNHRQRHDSMMNAEVAKYEIGKRHLANIMGEHPNDMTDEKIKEAIEYLFPSGLTDKKARPVFDDPRKILPKAKVAAFGMDGRPFHFLFYTGMPNFYEIMHNGAIELNVLRRLEEEDMKRGVVPELEKLSTAGQWVSRLKLADKLQERVKEADYLRLVALLDKILYHPYAAHSKKFLEQHRIFYDPGAAMADTKEIDADESGRQFVEAAGKRKRSTATVTVRTEGTGKMSINGKSFLKSFPQLCAREQVAFPLRYTGLIGAVDIEAQVEGPEDAWQSKAGAIRLAICRALVNIIDPEVADRMRLMGMLTQDPRNRERKKPGQKRARKKFTWKKR